MSERGIMMTCGCAAQGTCSKKDGRVFDPPIPACLTHDCFEVAAAAPDLTGRTARCSYFGPINFRSYECNFREQTGCSRKRCACELPSNATLPFFEYRGLGSRNATLRCKHCSYFKTAHESRGHRCRGFEPIGDTGHDRFYCGCAGWD